LATSLLVISFQSWRWQIRGLFVGLPWCVWRELCVTVISAVDRGDEWVRGNVSFPILDSMRHLERIAINISAGTKSYVYEVDYIKIIEHLAKSGAPLRLIYLELEYSDPFEMIERTVDHLFVGRKPKLVLRDSWKPSSIGASFHQTPPVDINSISRQYKMGIAYVYLVNFVYDGRIHGP
jgi:hypothetical protein